jgi:5-oxopent-3-ene-1,2,5-tricarboxylate decarboxylase/2-hydroxyhepta-2,4-diene-1,7-dioate isomerase
VKHVRIEHDGRILEGELTGDEVRAGDLTLPVAQVQRWLAPVEPSKIVATHLTYRSRAEEYKMARLPEAPSYFLKPPSSLSGPPGARRPPARLPLPQLRGRGRRGHRPPLPRRVGRRGARLRAGLHVANDWGVHDFRHADRGSMLRVKGQDGFCPLGPVMVDAADVDPEDLTLRTFVNGRRSSTATPARTSCSPSPTRWPTSPG